MNNLGEFVMSEDREFGFSLFGFSKKKVTKFIEVTMQGFEGELQEKNNEIFKLKSNLRELRPAIELIPEMQDKIKSFENIKKSMEEELHDEKTRSSLLKQQISNAEINILAYEAELNQLRNSNTILEKSISDLEYDETIKVNDLQEKYEAQLNLLRNNIITLKESISDLEYDKTIIENDLRQEYENELNLLRNNILELNKAISDLGNDVSMKENDLQKEFEQLNYGKSQVTEALIFANEKAESMIASAKIKTEEEIERRNIILASYREKYNELISFINAFREQAASTFKSLDESIIELIESNEYDNSPSSLEITRGMQNISYPIFVKSGT
jgi:cell division protein FtsB